MTYEFLVETYETERIKVVSVWSEFRDEDLPVRPRAGDPRGRSVHEQMVHQCVSENLWFIGMLGMRERESVVYRHAGDRRQRAATAGDRDSAGIHEALRGGQREAAGGAAGER